jgi:hypothetical protein
MAAGLALAALLCLLPFAGAVRGETPSAAAPPPPELFDGFAAGGRIDELVLAKLKASGIPPSEKCTDEVFVRRVFLDTIGTLPSPAEVRAFLADTDPGKRRRLIDGLLDRREFAEYRALKWGDLLRVKSEFPSNLWPNAVQAYDRWIRESLRRNMPYDQFARELLTASGSNFRNPPANFYRAFQERTPRQIAGNAALVFMGVRLEDGGLTEAQILGLSAFFAKVGYKCTDEWKEEIVFFNPEGVLVDPKDGKPVRPAFPGDRPLDLAPGQDPRPLFADWLTAPGNPWFARNAVNRVWFWLLGRGIVHEPDDMKPANAPWSPELLAYLERELVAHKYDIRHIYRLILNSNTYQLSSRPNAWNVADTTGFSHYRIRRLDAEPLLDAVNQVLGTGERYTSNIPEPFTFLPGNRRAICLADGSIESSFLELFGRPPRNSSFESERTSASSVFQAQHMLNSSHIQKKIEQSAVLRQLASGKPVAPRPAKEAAAAKPPGGGKKGITAREAKIVPGGVRRPMVVEPDRQEVLVEELYLRILSRFPSAAEKAVALAYLKAPGRQPAAALCDLVWALLNTKEFILKH